MSLAWLAYVPVPGIQVIPVLLRPEDRQVRFHAWQGLFTVLVAWAVLAALGGLAGWGGAVGRVAGLASMAWLMTMFGVLVWAGAGAAAGGFPRVPGMYHVASLLKL